MAARIRDRTVPDCFAEKIFGLIFPDLRSLEPSRNEMPEEYLQRLPVSFIHGKKEKRQHYQDHGHGGQSHISCLPDKKKERQSDEDCCSETENLTFGEVQKELAFYPRQVSGYIGIQIVQ